MTASGPSGTVDSIRLGSGGILPRISLKTTAEVEPSKGSRPVAWRSRLALSGHQLVQLDPHVGHTGYRSEILVSRQPMGKRRALRNP